MQSEQKAGCFVGLAAIAVYGVVGFLLLWQFGGQVINYFNSMNWQQVSGIVIVSEIEDVSDTSGERYTGRIIYTYEIERVTYEGNQVDLRGTIYVGNRDDAEQLVAPYPVGTSVMPYVDFNNPTRSVLDRHMLSAVWWLVGIGSLLGSVAKN